ncbi:hypothetical protein [Futiania mangrovi]|uniref:Uncharacterized protein n=1 Tax=Futiania mangrovi TaxID=2959716 RepID=A0A9J6PBK5_9PROT|nr:hypothetical protein [Futiania mangrovii]MCP1334939.1 hypothetical protein [Futiania mangrovii]
MSRGAMRGLAILGIALLLLAMKLATDWKRAQTEEPPPAASAPASTD